MKRHLDPHAARRALWVLLLIPALTGCGALLVNGPPAGWENVEDLSELETVALMAPCSNGKALIYMDAAMAAYVGLMFGLIAAEDSYSFSGSEKTYGLIYTGILTGAFSSSAVAGNRRVNDCAAFNAHVYQSLRNSTEGDGNR